MKYEMGAESPPYSDRWVKGGRPQRAGAGRIVPVRNEGKP